MNFRILAAPVRPHGRVVALMAATAFSAALLVPAAQAQQPALDTPAGKAAIEQIVRDYLLAHPEVLVESLTAFQERQEAAQAEAQRGALVSRQEELFRNPASPVAGNPQGDVTLVEFIDYRCGYCKKINPELEALLKEDGNIRFILKEFPILTEESQLAARFAVAVQQIAGPDAYKKTHDALMESRGPVTLESLKTLAGGVGVDADAVISRMNTEEVSAVLRKNHQLAEQMRIMGTPTFIIEGEMLRGIPAQGLGPVIEQIRAAKQG